MKRFLFALSSLLSVTGFTAQRIELPWTMDAASVQAVVEDVLRQSKEKDIEPVAGGFRVRDAKTTLVCQERAASPLAVQTYRCSIETNSATTDQLRLELPMTMDAASVQATLVHAMGEYYAADQASTYPQGFVKPVDSGYEISDDHFKLVCVERSHGTLAVQMYGCTLTAYPK